MSREDNLQKRYLDGEILYRKYFELGDAGTFVRLRRFAESERMVSPSGNPPTLMGIWKSMWRWASLIQNKETAWEIYKVYNPDISRETWNQMMLEKISKAWQFKSITKQDRFLKENGWL